MFHGEQFQSEGVAVKEMRTEALAMLLHESGREAVKKGKVYAKESDRKPFCEWSELPEEAKDGRRIMAKYLIRYKDIVAEALQLI